MRVTDYYWQTDGHHKNIIATEAARPDVEHEKKNLLLAAKEYQCLVFWQIDDQKGIKIQEAVVWLQFFFNLLHVHWLL